MNKKVKVSVYIEPETRKSLDAIYMDYMKTGDKKTYSEIVSMLINTYIKKTSLSF